MPEQEQQCNQSQSVLTQLVQIGLSFSTSADTGKAPITGRVVAQSDSKRTYLGFSHDGSDTVTLSTITDDGQTSQYVLLPTNNIIEFTLEVHKKLVQQEWRVRSVGGSADIFTTRVVFRGT